MKIRNFLILVSFPLLFSIGLTACGQNSDTSVEPVNDPGAGEIAEEAASKTGDILEEAGEAVAQGVESAADAISAAVEKELEENNALGLTIRNILDEDVYTQSGETAARLDDLLFDSEGRPVAAILRDVGMFGISGEEIVVTIQRLIIKQDDAGEAVVEMTLTDNEIERLAGGVEFLPSDFSMGNNIDVSLLSARKLLEIGVYNREGGKVADVYDVLLGPEWRFTDVVLSTGGVSNIGDRLVTAGWDVFRFSDDNTALETTLLAPAFDSLPAFSYEAFIEN